MSDQFNEDGEIYERQEPSLSRRAADAVRRPSHWETRTERMIEGAGGANFELAFLSAQSEIEPIILADAEGNFNKNKYATLANLLAKIRPIIAKHKLTMTQGCGQIYALGVEGKKQYFMPVFTEVTQVPSLEVKRFVMPMPLVQMSPHAIGSAFTYGRRFSLCGVWGIASVDDDGAAASFKKTLEADHDKDAFEVIQEALKGAESIDKLRTIAKQKQESTENMSDDKREKLSEVYKTRLKELQDASQEAEPKKGK